MARGDVRAAILVLLAEQAMHGYQIMQTLSDRSGGAWQPSAGSIYPTLQQLEDEGLVVAEEGEGRRVFRLTDAGRQVAEAAKARSATPWESAGDEGSNDLGPLFLGVAEAVRQVAMVGSPADLDEARRLLTETRRRLYALLAAGDASDSTESP